MNGVPRSEDEPGADSARDGSLLSTVDAASTQAVTLDPEVARIPGRAFVPRPDPMPRPGDTLGRFKVLSELGRGGMGVVYAAEDSTLGREVALKVLPTSGDDERRGRFLREARAAAGLTHAGIATIYDVGEAAGHVFIAMELVRGRTLRAVLDERPEGDRALPLAEALRVGREIARALAKAHERGVVHRDLKPENVMLAEDGQVKLLDFGLAKRCEPEPAGQSGVMTTEAGRVLGTPSYMSPEQSKGRPVDARSDVFSLGVMLYELCTGARPFARANVIELFIALDRDEPPPPSTLDARVPLAVEHVILRCLRKDPAARYADAGAVLHDLELLSARASGFPKGARSRPPGRGPGRGRRAQLAALVLVAVVVGLTVGLRVSRHFRPAPVTLATLPMPASTSAEAIAAYREGLSGYRLGGRGDGGFERAVELDPGLAAAHLQLATMAMFGSEESGREHYRKAEELRTALDERDRALLDAIEPVARRQPSDWAESKRRLAALLQRYPDDAELWFLHAGGAANFDDFAESAQDSARALALDPGFTHAASYEALALEYLGRFAEAHAVIDRCMARSPSADTCLLQLATLQNHEGACEGMEATARQIITSSPHPAHGYSLLANALAARGQPMATVRESLRQALEARGPVPASMASEIKQMMVGTAALTAIFEGDFAAAEKGAAEFAPLVASSKRQTAHGILALELAQVFEETGRPKEEGRVALDFLDRRDAWEPDPSAEDMALAHDATPTLLRAALHSGAASPADLAARREAWLRTWTARVTPVSRNYVWLHAYARAADTPAAAREALAALPGYEALPPFRPDTPVDADVGRTYLLAERPAEALPWLEHATHTCMVLSFPIDYVRAHLLLGEAREATGDRTGACASYRAVIARWGQAKPRSLTAEKAQERVQALSCAG
jgi:tetratricopeptide (TPR) repeat protein/predicted Ser/Thr protein kinase